MTRSDLDGTSEYAQLEVWIHQLEQPGDLTQ